MRKNGDDSTGDEGVLAAQIGYYRAVAREYLDGTLDEPGVDELVDAVEERAPRGFAAFWQLVDRCLLPGGSVLFVDDAYRADDELVEGAASTTIQRRLRDGTPHRAVKVPYEAGALQCELAELGWDIAVHPTRGPFYWGSGRRSGE